jgi:hypothetical protein
VLRPVAGGGNNGQVAAFAAPAFTRPGPMLDRFGEVLLGLPWIVSAAEFAPGVPSRDMPPHVLARFVIAQACYAERDQIWDGIATRAREPRTSNAYQPIAVGVAAPRLRRDRNHARPRQRRRGSRPRRRPHPWPAPPPRENRQPLASTESSAATTVNGPAVVVRVAL